MQREGDARRGGRAYLSPRCRLRSSDASSSGAPLPPPNQPPPPPLGCSSTSQSSRIWGGPMRVPSRVGTRGSADVGTLLGSPSGATSKKPVMLQGGGGLGFRFWGMGNVAGWLRNSEDGWLMRLVGEKADALQLRLAAPCGCGQPRPCSVPARPAKESRGAVQRRNDTSVEATTLRSTVERSPPATQPLDALLQLGHRHAANLLHRHGAQVANVANGHAVDLQPTGRGGRDRLQKSTGMRRAHRRLTHAGVARPASTASGHGALAWMARRAARCSRRPAS